MPNIQTKIEQPRSAGYRKESGLYLTADALPGMCAQLPSPLTFCPCCSQGFKPSGAFTWISGRLLPKGKCSNEFCELCRAKLASERFLLTWVSEKFYQSPAAFTNEALMLGVSRRIAQVPKDFKLGETWVMLAHRRAIVKYVGKSNEPVFTPGIFHAFRPSRIEYVVRGDESEEELEAKEKRGFTLVKVIRDVDAQLSLID